MESHKYIELEQARIGKELKLLIEASSLLIESKMKDYERNFIELKRRIKKSIRYQSQLEVLSSEYLELKKEILKQVKDLSVEQLLDFPYSQNTFPSLENDIIKRRNLNQTEEWKRYEAEVQAMKAFISDTGEEEEPYQLTQSDKEDLLVDSKHATNANDDILFVSSVTKSLICPLTQQEFREPVLNVKCEHTFEKDALIQNGRLVYSNCPINGCRTTSMSLRDIVPDEDMINRLKRKKALRIF